MRRGITMSEHYDSFKFEHQGREFLARLYSDHDRGAPWEESDGHGPVSDWTGRDKKSGELILNTDGEHKRFYDYAKAMRIAKRDHWGVGDGPREGETAGQYRHRAVMADFEFLRGWCNHDWHYCGVSVCLITDEDSEPNDDFYHALWGIESNAGDYLREVAAELAEEITRELEEEQRAADTESAERAYWASRDVETKGLE